MISQHRTNKISGGSEKDAVVFFIKSRWSMENEGYHVEGYLQRKEKADYFRSASGASGMYVLRKNLLASSHYLLRGACLYDGNHSIKRLKRLRWETPRP